MATPTTGTLNVIGSSGGMAPFPTSVYADIEGAGSTWATGSGNWTEGRWAFQLIDNATGQVYDSGLMDLQCPLSSVTATAYNRYGASPNAGCVVFDTGTYYWRVKYQNRDGDWSAWSNSSTFTVAANTRTKVYVDGTSGNDANNGLSAGAAKKTLNGGLAAIAGDDYEIILKDDTTIDVTAGTDITTRSGIWIHRSGDGTAKPIVVCKHTTGPVYAIQCGSDTVVDGIEFEYDGVAYRFVFGTESNKSNIAWLNLDTHEINAFAELPTGTAVSGVVIYGCTMKELVYRYMVFADGPSVFNILGCTWDKGSVDEHIIRLMWQNTSTSASKFFSIDFCVLDQADRGKTMLRAFHRRFLGVYRCDLRGGSVSISNLDTSVGDQASERFEDYRFDCCRMLLDTTVAGLQQSVAIYEGVKNLVFASCQVYRDALQQSPAVFITRRTNGNIAPADNIKFINCTLSITTTFMEPVLDVGLNFDAANVIDLNVSGCLLISSESSAAYHYYDLTRFRSGIPSTLSMSENVAWLATHLDPNIAGGKINIVNDTSTDPDTVYKNISEVNAESWASGNLQEALSVSPTTAEPSGPTTGWQSVVTNITGLFESINGEVFDRNDATWAAGAWQPVGSGTGGVAGYPTDDVPAPSSTSYLGLSAGGQFIVLET